MCKTALILLCFLLAPLSARADLGMLDPLAKPTTRIAPGFMLALDVSIRSITEPELSGQFPLDAQGQLQLTVGMKSITKIPLKGLTTAQAQEKITAAVGKYFARDPEVHVGIARIPRIRVQVVGATFYNGPVTILEGARLSDALAEARYLPTADLSRVQIVRANKDGSKAQLLADFRRALEGATDETTDPLLQDNDRIVLDTVPIVEAPKTIAVLGEVKNPNIFPYKKGMTVRDALLEAFDMLPTADPDRVTIRRMRDNAFMTVNGLRAKQSIATDNLPLEPDDTVIVARKDTGLRYAVVGAVVNPTTFDYKGPVTLKQALGAVGGFKPDADRHSIFLTRNMLTDPANSQAVPIDYDKLARGEIPDPPLKPGDMVTVVPRRKQPSPLVNLGLFLLRRFLPF